MITEIYALVMKRMRKQYLVKMKEGKKICFSATGKNYKNSFVIIPSIRQSCL
jgi:hypothetical protein